MDLGQRGEFTLPLSYPMETPSAPSGKPSKKEIPEWVLGILVIIAIMGGSAGILAAFTWIAKADIEREDERVRKAIEAQGGKVDAEREKLRRESLTSYLEALKAITSENITTWGEGLQTEIGRAIERERIDATMRKDGNIDPEAAKQKIREELSKALEALINDLEKSNEELIQSLTKESPPPSGSAE